MGSFRQVLQDYFKNTCQSCNIAAPFFSSHKTLCSLPVICPPVRVPPKEHNPSWKRSTASLCHQEKVVLKRLSHVGPIKISTQNEKLTLERTYSEDSVNKLVKVNAELRVGAEQRTACRTVLN